MNGKMAKIDLDNEYEKRKYEYDNNYGIDIGINNKTKLSSALINEQKKDILKLKKG